MKLKKCIMTLMCALSVLLSSFAFGFVSKAAFIDETKIDKPSLGPMLQGPVIEIKNDADYEIGSNGNDFGYTTSENGNVYFTVDIPIPYSAYKNSGVNTSLASSTRSVAWDCYGDITMKYLQVIEGTDIDNLWFYMWIDSAQIIAYNQKFDIDVNMNGGTAGVVNPTDSRVFNVNEWVLIDNVPQLGLFDDAFLTLKLKVGCNWSVDGYDDVTYSIYPQFGFDLRYLRYLEYSDPVEDCLESMIDNQLLTLEEIENIRMHLTQGNSSDKQNTDSLKENSDSQSDKLNDLNEQNKMDKIDVDSASSSVDANIDGNAISNYGVVLSSITGQGKVVQLMLIVLSVGLVSYVLFGKR